MDHTPTGMHTAVYVLTCTRPNSNCSSAVNKTVGGDPRQTYPGKTSHALGNGLTEARDLFSSANHYTVQNV